MPSRLIALSHPVDTEACEHNAQIWASRFKVAMRPKYTKKQPRKLAQIRRSKAEGGAALVKLLMADPPALTKHHQKVSSFAHMRGPKRGVP